ncbi:MAG: hypothetical protein ABJA82_15780 [Myxococcales bacterium]
MSTLRVISPSEAPPRLSPSGAMKFHRVWRWGGVVGACLAFVAACVVIWWVTNTDRREIQALPETQRIPLYRRTIQNLKTVCDPAAPRSLRDFCHNEAELVLRFRECDSDQECQELARRHMGRAYR